jgi:hypothetical protein
VTIESLTFPTHKGPLVTTHEEAGITRRFLGWKDQHGTDYAAGASINMPGKA